MLLLLLCICFVRGNVIVVELNTDDKDVISSFAEKHSLELLPNDDSKHLPLHFWAFNAPRHRTREISQRLNESSNVVWHEIQVAKRRYTRNDINVRGAPRLGRSTVASDPLYASQWHLHGNVNSLNIEQAWRDGITGRGVVVAIVDDGVQIRHPDLTVDKGHSRDYNSNRGHDCSPYTTDGHGTSAAGVCCAKRNNGQCGSGVAPESTLVGIRLIAEPVSDFTESSALSYEHKDIIDIYSCSWGPMDDASSLEQPGRLTRMILKQNTDPVTGGRNGKGNIYVWAGGNGRDQQDNCNYDGYANSIYTIAVGAIDHMGYQSWYSESCSALFVVAPSSGSHLGITTTDLTGRNGYAQGQCCNTFGGTSSAAPAVAGAIALLLQKRSDLTWRDVQHVLAKSSVQPVRSVLTDQSNNARGYTHSEQFGFGRVDIPSMLSVADSWVLVPPKTIITQSLVRKTPHSGLAGPFAIGIFNINTELSFIEHITLSLSVTCPRRGNLRITLTSPSGIISTLFSAHSADRHSNIPSSHTFMSARYWGDTLYENDEWKLIVEDTLKRGNSYLHSATIQIHGY